jgi:GxxExxY protein
LLESVYEVVLFEEFSRSGLAVERQVPIDIRFRGLVIDNAFRADLIVEGKLLVELKSTETMSKVHAKQVLTYLRLTGLPLGFLMNFGMERFADGFKRFGNGYFAEL